jgi:hypothetical protein
MVTVHFQFLRVSSGINTTQQTAQKLSSSSSNYTGQQLKNISDNLE